MALFLQQLLLCAVKMIPETRDYIIASHVSNEPAGRMLLEELKLSPFLDCNMCLGEGSGAVAAMPLLDMACRYIDKWNICRY